MVEAFDIGDVNPNPARFDLKKADAINASHMRLLSHRGHHRARRCRSSTQAGVVSTRYPTPTPQLLDLAMPLVGERINKLTEAVDMLGFLFVDEADFTRTDELDEAGREVVKAAYDAARRP